jgi:hypothetical protein
MISYVYEKRERSKGAAYSSVTHKLMVHSDRGYDVD